MSRKQVHEQFIQVASADEAIRWENRVGTIELGRVDSPGFCTGGPRDQQSIERLQHRHQRRTLARASPGTASEHSDAAMISGKKLENAARVPIRPMMEHVRGLKLYSAAGHERNRRRGRTNLAVQCEQL